MTLPIPIDLLTTSELRRFRNRARKHGYWKTARMIAMVLTRREITTRRAS